jgi:hypothetical protein
VPQLEAGFRRQTIDYIVAANGLDIDYAVIDRQVNDAAPWPATKLTGTFGESTTDGILYMTDLHLRLDGPPGADKRMMIARGVQIAQQKMEIVLPDNDQNKQAIGYRVLNAALVEHLGDANAVEVHFTIQHQKENPKEYLTNLWTKWLGTPLSLPAAAGEPEAYDPAKSREPALYGYTPHTNGNRDPAALFVLGCYLQTPCGPHGILRGTDDEGEPSPVSPGDDLPVTITGGQSPGELSNSPGDRYSAATHDAMYTMCRAETRYTIEGNRVQLPIALSRSAYQAGDDTCVVVDVSLPTCTRKIIMDFERVGKWPTLPNPVSSYNDGGLTGTFLSHWIRPHPPTLSADGRAPIYRIAACYLYAMNRPPEVDESVKLGSLPFTNFDISNSDLALSEVYET